VIGQGQTRRPLEPCRDLRLAMSAAKGEEMPRAVWKGAVLAESDRCETIEGNCYLS